MKRLCIYHANCADGFGAAWVVKQRFGLDEVEFYPGIYQNNPPDVLGRDVILVDFSYKQEVVQRMMSQANSITIIDHHKSAIQDLQPLVEAYRDIPDRLYTLLDTNHSGAMLAWNYYFGKHQGHEPPALIKHIEDRDLWKFKLPHTREIQANLFSFPYDFFVWDRLMEMTEEELIDFAKEGEAIERKHFKDIEENLGTSVRPMKIDGLIIPIINCPKEWGSDAANLLAKQRQAKGELPIAGYYWDSAVGRNFGLRSIGNAPEVDCSRICVKYGGGGHHNTAGFRANPDLAKRLEFGSVWDPCFIPF